MTLKLVLGPNTLDLDDWGTHGIVITDVDLGFPTPREVVTTLPGQDGESDETAYLGPRVISIKGNAGPGSDGSRSKGMSLLAPFLDPKARPQLIYADPFDTLPDRSFTLRSADLTAPVTSGSTISFTISWKCPDPIGYGIELNEIDMPPATAGSAGFTFPLAFPLAFPPTLGGGGRTFITTQGNYTTWPLIRILGPAKNPVIAWLDPYTEDPLGPQIVFAGLSVLLGDYLEIDTKARTVVLNGDPNANRFSFLDLDVTEWAPLAGGLNLLRFTSVAAPPPSIAKVFWRDALLT